MFERLNTPTGYVVHAAKGVGGMGGYEEEEGEGEGRGRFCPASRAVCESAFCAQSYVIWGGGGIE